MKIKQPRIHCINHSVAKFHPSFHFSNDHYYFSNLKHVYISFIRKKKRGIIDDITWQNTKELKISVLRIKSESDPSKWKTAFPEVWRYHIITNWYIDCPNMFLHITLLMKFPFLPTGGRFIKAAFGGSVAKARAPSVSIIMLTHRSWTAVRGAFPESSTGWSHNNREKHKTDSNIDLRNKLCTSQTGWRKIDNEGNHIYCQLKLHKLLDVHVNWASPFCYSHYCGEIII